ncbi:MAG: hypothetical protein V5A72_02050 [Candidatus Nanohaloarchaea archaeon]
MKGTATDYSRPIEKHEIDYTSIYNSKEEAAGAARELGRYIDLKIGGDLIGVELNHEEGKLTGIELTEKKRGFFNEFRNLLNEIHGGKPKATIMFDYSESNEDYQLNAKVQFDSGLDYDTRDNIQNIAERHLEKDKLGSFGGAGN